MWNGGGIIISPIIVVCHRWSSIRRRFLGASTLSCRELSSLELGQILEGGVGLKENGKKGLKAYSPDLLGSPRIITTTTNSFVLTFRDIEDSIKSFDGSPGYPITKWTVDFEKIAKLIQWNDLQKLIFAKKSLSGLTKLFVQSQRGIQSWSIPKKKLIEEFEQKVSRSQVHKILMTRKKKRYESVQEYTLMMREIDSRSNVVYYR